MSEHRKMGTSRLVIRNRKIVREGPDPRAAEIAALRDQLAAMREALEIATRYVGHDPDCDGFESMGHCHCDYTTLKNVWERPFTDTAAAGQAWRDRVRAEAVAERDKEYQQSFRLHLGGCIKMDPDLAREILTAIREARKP